MADRRHHCASWWDRKSKFESADKRHQTSKRQRTKHDVIIVPRGQSTCTDSLATVDDHFEIKRGDPADPNATVRLDGPRPWPTAAPVLSTAQIGQRPRVLERASTDRGEIKQRSPSLPGDGGRNARRKPSNRASRRDFVKRSSFAEVCKCFCSFCSNVSGLAYVR